MYLSVAASHLFFYWKCKKGNKYKLNRGRCKRKRRIFYSSDQKRKEGIYSFGRESEEVYYACHHRISNSCQYAVSKEGHNKKISLLIVLKDFYIIYIYRSLCYVEVYK